MENNGQIDVEKEQKLEVKEKREMDEEGEEKMVEELNGKANGLEGENQGMETTDMENGGFD